MNSMKIKRVLCLIAAVVMIVSNITLTVFADSMGDAKNSVELVQSQMGWGSGFAIGVPGKPVEYIVTNNHVVGGDWGYTTATVGFAIASDDKMVANIYMYDAEKDIAILKLPTPTDKREPLVLKPMEYVDLDDSFAALGYPGNQASDWYKFNLNDITITRGGVKKTDRVMGHDVYMLDLDITNGNSGGPLVDSSGKVVGINTFGVNYDKYAIAIDELLSIIDRNRIPVAVHGDTNWVLIGCGAAALAIIVLLLVVIIIILKSKKTKESKKVELIAIGGVLNGKRYNVSETVRLGRDPSQCKITFPADTRGVGRVHCEISYDGGRCCLRDLNSTYGTFIVGGRKLAPHEVYILRSGERFYLAAPDNTFEVRY